jgi:CTP:phosphocholine cytidylyltransferase-like protein
MCEHTWITGNVFNVLVSNTLENTWILDKDSRLQKNIYVRKKVNKK